MSRHVAHERWTRELLGSVGTDRPIAATEPRVSWCGTRVSASEWTFVDATHVLMSLQQESSIAPCPDCVLAIASVAVGELDRVGVPPSSTATIDEILRRRKAR